MSLDLNNLLSMTVSQATLGIESNDGRFESFCCDVVSLIEGGAIIFSTSRSWDLGRDGVGAGAARGVYVCTTLRDDLDDKTISDLKRIVSTTREISRIYFCSSQKLSEHRITLLEGQILDEIDHALPISCLGATQLTEAAKRDPSVITRHYGAEVTGALRAISPDIDDKSEVAGLRLALIAAAGDNSTQIRSQLYEGAVLASLADGKPRTIAGCAKAISEKLRVGYVISGTALVPHITDAVNAGYISNTGPAYVITPHGAARLQRLDAEAAQRLLGGRHSVRAAIEEAIGDRLSEDDFNRIWGVFEERVAQYFHARGAAMVAEVAALLHPEDPAVEGLPAAQLRLSFLDELATAVAHTSTHAQRRSELRQAIIDMFMDRTSGATDWLVRVAASYVACCALGLEQTSSAALSKLFARTTLVLDTDVALSLLGEGEPDHESVFAIASRWTKVGGKVLVAEPVLEEVAYHAFIAQYDYDQVRHLIPGTRDDRIRLIENVFVRSFCEHIAGGNGAPGHWPRFIQQFRGRTEYDWQPAISHLRSEYSIGLLPPRTSEYEQLEMQVRKFLLESAADRGYDGKIARDKATRDARLYAGMVSYLSTARARDPGATCLLVSSAHRLAEAEDQFHESGEQQIVVPISTVLHLLSLLPEITLGLSAMKAFLFEERRPGFSSDLERTLLRLVRTSREVTMPWAKRGTLMREVRDRLIDDARKQGRTMVPEMSTASLERDAMAESNRPRTVELLADALDRIAVSTRTENENMRLRRENEQLRAQLARPRSEKKARKAKKE